MFDISTINKRYFGIKLTVTDEEDKQHSVTLEVEPPKIKALKNLLAISKASNEDSMDELSNGVQKMLSKNKAKYIVPMEYIDNLDYDELQEILTAYFDWMAQTRKEKN